MKKTCLWGIELKVLVRLSSHVEVQRPTNLFVRGSRTWSDAAAGARPSSSQQLRTPSHGAPQIGAPLPTSGNERTKRRGRTFSRSENEKKLKWIQLRRVCMETQEAGECRTVKFTLVYFSFGSTIVHTGHSIHC